MCDLTHRGKGWTCAERPGTTILELLVVVAIASLLAGMLLAAVQKARAAGARLSCQSRIRQLALAVHQYDSTRESLPAGCDYPFGRDGSAPLRQVGLSWQTSILPFVEQDALWMQAWEANQTNPVGDNAAHDAVRAAIVQVFLCPADSRSTGRTHKGATWGLTGYVGVAGTGVRNNDGMFHTAYRVRLADITDGTSQTLMIGERPPGPRGQFGGWYSAWGQSPCAVSSVLGTADGADVGTSGDTCPPNSGPLRPGRLESRCDVSHFWSLHPGGAAFAFADGSVRFLAYSRSSVLPALATRAGGEVVPET